MPKEQIVSSSETVGPNKSVQLQEAQLNKKGLLKYKR
jgi:hypothetical protein